MKLPPMRRRSLLALGVLSGAPSLLASSARAQVRLPDRPLRILVGFSAGGGAELMARIMAPRLEQRTGRRAAVENKPNDRAEPAGEFLRKALVEGAAVAFLPTTTIVTMPDREAFPFDSKSDLVPLTMAGTFQVALTAAPSTGVSTFAAYAAWLKNGPPERRQIGTSSGDDYLKLYALMIARELGVTLEPMLYKSAAALAVALREGKIPAGIASAATLLEHNRSGSLKTLMTSGARRLSVLRTVPTAREVGYPGLELHEWYGFFGSSASPPAIMAEWSRQLQAILAEPEVMAQFAHLGLDVDPSTQAEAAERFKARLQVWQEKKEAFGLK